MQATNSKFLEAIVKIAARCNINCSYCYVFNGADTSFKSRPATMSLHTVSSISRFLRTGCKDLGIQEIRVNLHGGEPLLVGKQLFDQICTELIRELKDSGTVVFTLQTNGILIDQDWIALFEKHNIRIGVSIDGPQEIHDAARVDFRSKGTYPLVRRGSDLLMEAFRSKKIRKPGALCVINDPMRPAKSIYEHLTKELGYSYIDFLLPDLTHEALTAQGAIDFGRFLIDLFNCWWAQDDPSIRVRILNSVLSLMLGGNSEVVGFGLERPLMITINTDGSLEPDDTLRSCGTAMIASDFNVMNNTLRQFAYSDLMKGLDYAHHELPILCQQCCWMNVCGAGHMVHRYSKEGRFNNPSVFCEGLKIFYAHVAKCLVEKGLPVNFLEEQLLTPHVLKD
jgi:uncharacterized protein